mmetsp:Transcript_37585/g.100191  ORF Transcript_37585/g.100191 Transcript_37585/m.100191 type:complete len:338 (+) Transcript_37585:61-1074(+)
MYGHSFCDLQIRSCESLLLLHLLRLGTRRQAQRRHALVAAVLPDLGPATRAEEAVASNELLGVAPLREGHLLGLEQHGELELPVGRHGLDDLLHLRVLAGAGEAQGLEGRVQVGIIAVAVAGHIRLDLLQGGSGESVKKALSALLNFDRHRRQFGINKGSTDEEHGNRINEGETSDAESGSSRGQNEVVREGEGKEGCTEGDEDPRQRETSQLERDCVLEIALAEARGRSASHHALAPLQRRGQGDGGAAGGEGCAGRCSAGGLESLRTHAGGTDLRGLHGPRCDQPLRPRREEAHGRGGSNAGGHGQGRAGAARRGLCGEVGHRKVWGCERHTEKG